MSSKSPQKKKGKSKRAHVLVAAVERATANFVERGQQIALENPDIEPEMIQAVEEVQNTGEAMSSTAREFAIDPCSSAKRGNMVSSINPIRKYARRILDEQCIVTDHLCIDWPKAVFRLAYLFFGVCYSILLRKVLISLELDGWIFWIMTLFLIHTPFSAPLLPFLIDSSLH